MYNYMFCYIIVQFFSQLHKKYRIDADVDKKIMCSQLCPCSRTWKSKFAPELFQSVDFFAENSHKIQISTIPTVMPRSPQKIIF